MDSGTVRRLSSAAWISLSRSLGVQGALVLCGDLCATARCAGSTTGAGASRCSAAEEPCMPAAAPGMAGTRPDPPMDRLRGGAERCASDSSDSSAPAAGGSDMCGSGSGCSSVSLEARRCSSSARCRLIWIHWCCSSCAALGRWSGLLVSACRGGREVKWTGGVSRRRVPWGARPPSRPLGSSAGCPVACTRQQASQLPQHCPLHPQHGRCAAPRRTWRTKSAHWPLRLLGNLMLSLYMISAAVCASSSTSKGGRPHTSSNASTPTAHTSTPGV